MMIGRITAGKRAREKAVALYITHKRLVWVWESTASEQVLTEAMHSMHPGEAIPCPGDSPRDAQGVAFRIRVESIDAKGVRLCITENRDVRSYDPDTVHWRKERSVFFLPYGEALELHRDDPNMAEYWNIWVMAHDNKQKIGGKHSR